MDWKFEIVESQQKIVVKLDDLKFWNSKSQNVDNYDKNRRKRYTEHYLAGSSKSQSVRFSSQTIITCKYSRIGICNIDWH